MTEINYEPSRSNGFFHSLVRRTASLITPRRVGLSLAGACAFVGTAAALNAHASTSPAVTTPGSQNIITQDTSAKSDADPPPPGGNSSSFASSNTSVSTNTSSQGAPDVQLTVNGKDIPVPTNSSTEQTVTGSNGSQTTVNVSSNVSSGDTTTNSSSSSLNLYVSSNTSSSEVNDTQ